MPKKTTNQTGIQAVVDIAGLSVTVVLASLRRLKVTAEGLLQGTTGLGFSEINITDGANVLLQYDAFYHDTVGGATTHNVIFVGSRAAGTWTFKARARYTGTAGAVLCDANRRAFILVEDIGAG